MYQGKSKPTNIKSRAESLIKNEYLEAMSKQKFGHWKIQNRSKTPIQFYLAADTDMEQHCFWSIATSVSKINEKILLKWKSNTFCVEMNRFIDESYVQ